ncbi:MAG: hypothetical protein GEU28_00235 [Dehalococcoidia bacterium]|nr:hypothetical protein [Dehalococcoidia bacterium]
MSMYRALIIFGLGLVSAAAVLVGLAFLIGGEYGLLVIPVVVLVVSALAYVALKGGRRRRSLLPAIIPALLVLFFTLPSVGFAFGHFDSVFDFGPTVLGVLGGLTTLLGVVVAFVTESGGRAANATTPTHWRAFTGVAAALGAICVLSAILTIAGRESVSAEEREGATVVRMKQLEFEPEVLEVGTGEIRIVLENDDPTVHTFTIDELDVDEDVNGGSEALIEFEAPAAGSYEITCEVPGHEAMTGTIEVR